MKIINKTKSRHVKNAQTYKSKQKNVYKNVNDQKSMKTTSDQEGALMIRENSPELSCSYSKPEEKKIRKINNKVINMSQIESAV